MIFVLLWYLVPSILVSVCNGHRKLLGGQNVTTNHPFMVYLRKAEVDPRGYIAWLCGGALVGPKVVLTSAACVEDVQYLYVVAGYDKYIADKTKDDQCIKNTIRKVVTICVPKGYDKYIADKTKDDQCIKNTIRKVVTICVPKAYDLIYEELDKWAKYDIAVIKVDASIIGDPNYKKYCSYEPRQIAINYDDIHLQETNAEAMVFGWGHTKLWRQHNDNRNFNKNKLQYVSTLIYDKDLCMKAYKSFGIDPIIKKYMICTLRPGLFDDQGENLNKGDAKLKNGCSDNDSKEISDESADEDEEDAAAPEKIKSESDSDSKKKKKETEEVGICQNDHGGPLISWIRSSPKIIGIASVFQVKNNTCAGPFLFTSTYCSAEFLKCVVDTMSGNMAGKRRSMPDYCYLPPKVKGFDIIERSVVWKDDNDEQEKYLLRPQKPLSQILKEIR